MMQFKKVAVGCGFAAAVSVLVPAYGSTGRLFGSAPGFDSIIEIDPVSGEVLNTLNSPPRGNLDGLAFDGESLWYLGAAFDTLYQLDPDTGATRNTYDLPGVDFVPGETNSGVRGGLASLNGLIYITNWDFQVQDIEIFDPAVGEVVGILDINGMNPQAREFGNSGLAAIAGPNQLIVSTAVTQQLHFINPTTGVIESSVGHNQFGVLGIAVIGDELYLGSDLAGSDMNGVENIHVYTRDVQQIRTLQLQGTDGIYSLAGDPAIPEPGTAALLGLAGLALIRRRR